MVVAGGGTVPTTRMKKLNENDAERATASNDLNVERAKASKDQGAVKVVASKKRRRADEIRARAGTLDPPCAIFCVPPMSAVQWASV